MRQSPFNEQVVRSLLILPASLLLCALAALATTSTSPSPQVGTRIAYPNTLLNSSPSSFAPIAGTLLGAPDTGIVQFSANTVATYGDFRTILTYHTNDLASLIGVSQATLAKADFIAFDGNGDSAGFFEDSTWTFEDGTNTLVHTHHFLDGPNGPVIANNQRLGIGAAYNSIFASSIISIDFGILLFDLSSFGINTASPHFRVTLQGGATNTSNCGVQCPDLTLLGILNPVAVIEVTIDIKPGSFPNSINPANKGVVPVAILTTSTFNAADVDLTSLRFGATGTEASPVHYALEDIDGDGDIDVILHFRAKDTGIVCGINSGSVRGNTTSGEVIVGSDSVNTVGCR